MRDEMEEMVAEAVRDKEALRDEFAAIESGLQRIRKVHKVRKVRKVRRIVYLCVSVAAVACVVVGIFVRRTSVGDCRTLGNGVVLADLTLARGGMDFQPITDAIDEGRYEDADRMMAELRNIPAPDYNPETEEGSYRLALYKADMQTLDYLQAVSLMRQGRPAKARRLLKAIASDSSSFWKDSASGLLERM